MELARRRTRVLTGVQPVTAGLALASCLAVTAPAGADERACDDLLPPPREALGLEVGPRSCLMTETAMTLEGREYRRLDMGIDGRVEGWVADRGDYADYLTDAPDLAFGQTTDDPGTVQRAVTTYERDKGAAMVLVLPARAEDWNGKLWVTVHGRGRSFKRGNLRAWRDNLRPGDPAAGLDRYDRLFLAKGYALAQTHRLSEQGIGELESVLEDGRTSMDKALNDSARYVIDFTLVAEKAIAGRLGRAPARTYFYGHSAGGRVGRGIEYTRGLNEVDGRGPIFDGFLADDSAAGTWLPIVMKDGVDVLFADEASREAFVPMLEVSHQMYNNEWQSGGKVDFTTPSFLYNKRINARTLREKGLGDRHRMYEVRSVSHAGGESLPRGEVHNLDLARAMDGFADLLDAWVDRGVAPPPNRSDWPPLGDQDGDGIVERPAIAFPEVACPLGVFYPYPPGNETGVGVTSWAAFDASGLEPRDGRGVFVDMNRNGVWDLVETPSQAWQRLGLLAPGETLTREAYVDCVTDAAQRLHAEGIFSESTVALYEQEAAAAPLGP